MIILFYLFPNMFVWKNEDVGKQMSVFHIKQQLTFRSERGRGSWRHFCVLDGADCGLNEGFPTATVLKMSKKTGN